MALSRKLIFTELRAILILAGVGFIMTWIFYRTSKNFLLIGAFTACMWVLLWKGNEYLAHVIDRRMSWIESPLRSFLFGITGTIIYTVSIVFLLVKLFEFSFSVSFGDISGILYGSVLVTLIITLFMHGRGFLFEWRQSALDAEKLKRESVTARYESLKNQVNPHFLFNSLNALTNLVYENQDLAVKFIKQLSEVYRYVLDTRERELVSAEEEMKFLDSYMFLQQIRFGNNLNIDVKLQNTTTFFPPLVLQMLIENAIKHNEISAEHPLSISIYEQAGFIVVENNLMKKSVLREDSPGIGLSNISSRYEFLSINKVEFGEEDDKFVVKLPVIETNRSEI